MDGSDTPPEVARPVIISDETITRLNLEGYRHVWEPLKVVDEAREAISRMPNAKSGIVLGSGENTLLWKQKGWQTLDIIPETNADYICDANQLEKVVPEGSQDFLLAEYIKFDPKSREGVGRGRLLQQANRALKLGGTLIVQSAHVENVSTATVPDRQEFPRN